jgi:hypothetical protein
MRNCPAIIAKTSFKLRDTSAGSNMRFFSRSAELIRGQAKWTSNDIGANAVRPHASSRPSGSTIGFWRWLVKIMPVTISFAPDDFFQNPLPKPRADCPHQDPRCKRIRRSHLRKFRIPRTMISASPERPASAAREKSAYLIPYRFIRS